ncbi:TIGR04283 family arsenosugar biosynthesis glycosyltransferase [Primorskyibacter sp. S87]|uniref:TIGR04283 family arsenosugar biosynthesis glycosyltransferase n=1 Tax=Primorskyibacter sp. S87 TaxID=3415126 RepID=UPI003C7AF4D4
MPAQTDRAPISIVIPTLNAMGNLPRCLESLMEGLPAGLIRDVIVSDGESEDATCRLAEAAGASVVSGRASRGGQLRRGCALAKGDWLLVLHADSVLPPGWAEQVATHIHESSDPAAFHLSFRAAGLAPVWVAGWANFRSRVFGLPFGDQGLLLQRADYESAGGYPDIPLMEDVALVQSLKRAGKPPVLISTIISSGADRYRSNGWVRRGARNLWTQIRYFAGVSPEKLARAYMR